MEAMTRMRYPPQRRKGTWQNIKILVGLPGTTMARNIITPTRRSMTPFGLWLIVSLVPKGQTASFRCMVPINLENSRKSVRI